MKCHPIGRLADVQQQVGMINVGVDVEREDLSGPRRHAKPFASGYDTHRKWFKEIELRKGILSCKRIRWIRGPVKVARRPYLATLKVERFAVSA